MVKRKKAVQKIADQNKITVPVLLLLKEKVMDQYGVNGLDSPDIPHRSRRDVGGEDCGAKRVVLTGSLVLPERAL